MSTSKPKTYSVQTLSKHDSRVQMRDGRVASPKQQAYRFFYANAGSSHTPGKETPAQGRARGARRLAQAERDAKQLGYSFEWEDETDFPIEDCFGDHTAWCDDAMKGIEHTHEVYVCFMRNADGRVKQSLGGIIDPSREYRRVVEAELALEELG